MGGVRGRYRLISKTSLSRQLTIGCKLCAYTPSKQSMAVSKCKQQTCKDLCLYKQTVFSQPLHLSRNNDLLTLIKIRTACNNHVVPVQRPVVHHVTVSSTNHNCSKEGMEKSWFKKTKTKNGFFTKVCYTELLLSSVRHCIVVTLGPLNCAQIVWGRSRPGADKIPTKMCVNKNAFCYVYSNVLSAFGNLKHKNLTKPIKQKTSLISVGILSVVILSDSRLEAGVLRLHCKMVKWSWQD